MNAKEILKDEYIYSLLTPDDSIAVRDISIRVYFEVALFFVFYYSLEAGELFAAIFFYYLLAVWHSFWGYAGIGHELMHGRVFSSKYLNSFFYNFSSFLVWSNPAFFTKTHLHHHGHTFSPTDSESLGTTAWSKLDLVQYLLLDVPLMIRRVSYAILNSFGFKYGLGRILPIEKNQAVSARWIILFNSSLQCFIFLLLGDLVYNMALFFLPFFGQLINRILAKTQHLGLGKYASDGALKNSRSIHLPRVMRFLYANMNYHAEHHLIPTMPYYNLPLLSDYLVKVNGNHVCDFKSFLLEDFWALLHENKDFVEISRREADKKGVKSNSINDK